MQFSPRHASARLVAAVVLPIALDAHGANDIVIQSGDVERLYAVTGNPTNKDRTVVLEAGVYVLSANDSNGTPRPRGGAITLQEGMTLRGSNSYADADHDGVWDATFDGDPVISGNTVIDGTAVEPYEEVSPTGEPELDCVGSPDTSGVFASGSAVVYRHRSTISRVTILAAPGQFALGPPHSAYLPSSGYVTEISNTFLDGGFSGFGGAAFHSLGCRMRDANSTLRFEHNIARGMFFGLTSVNGITNQEGDRRRGPSLHAIMVANHFIGNFFGLHARNSVGTDGGLVDVQSTGNLFEGNEWGIDATAGADVGDQPVNGNRLDLMSSRDTFRQNSVGVVALGSWRQGLFNPSGNSDNKVRLTLLEGHFEDGDAVHAWSIFPEPRPGMDRGNRVSALIRNSSFGADPANPFRFVDTVPGDTNTVDIVGSAAAFQSSNGTPPIFTQLLVPPNPFDLRATANALHFAPASSGYQLTAGTGVVDSVVGPPVTFSGDPSLPFPGDDDTAEISLPFLFTYQGQSYGSVWVNTDGNLTFGEPDPASTLRDVTRFISGAPRIAALFNDLAPNIGGSVHANTFADRAVITWLGVPSWDSALADTNTVQIVLHAGGAIDLLYGDIGGAATNVGITTGSLATAPAAVDLSVGGLTGSTLYEAFFGIVGP